MDSQELCDLPEAGTEGVVEAEIVRQIRALRSFRWGTRRIAQEVGVDRKTVRRYLRDDSDEAIGSDFQSLACVLKSLPPAVTDYFRQLEFLHA